jgi:hypothetical protein
MLLLRTVKNDGSSSHGFVWPLEIGAVTRCPDPDPDPERDCGGGLHGLPWGEGDGSLLDWSVDRVGLVFEAQDDRIVRSEGKARCYGDVIVRYVGSVAECAEYLVKHGCRGRAIVGLSCQGGDCSVMTGGYRSAMTGGDYSVMTGGEYSTLIVRWNDGHASHVAVGVVGNDGIVAGEPYQVVGGEFVEFEPDGRTVLED